MQSFVTGFFPSTWFWDSSTLFGVAVLIPIYFPESFHCFTHPLPQVITSINIRDMKTMIWYIYQVTHLTQFSSFLYMSSYKWVGIDLCNFVLCIDLCNHPQNQDTELFCHHKEIFHATPSYSHLPPSPPFWQPLFCCLPL